MKTGGFSVWESEECSDLSFIFSPGKIDFVRLVSTKNMRVNTDLVQDVNEGRLIVLKLMRIYSRGKTIMNYPEALIQGIINLIKADPDAYVTRIKRNPKIRKMARLCFPGNDVDNTLLVLTEMAEYLLIEGEWKNADDNYKN